MHPVMFGEYIPLAEYIPFLYRITPLTGGLTVGGKAVCQELNGVRYAPDICYETVIPHLIRSQVRQLRQQGEEPDVLVNVTNDGWFRGSSELDMHLACGVFRAIEMRKPLLIAANTGISAWIDSDGRIVRQAPPMKGTYLIADVQLDNRHSPYLDYGDWFSGLCLAACLGVAMVGMLDHRKSREKVPV
jgi:apolipoprotein N-acyltransferase